MRDQRVDIDLESAPTWQREVMQRDPEGIITGGHGNETGRVIAIYEGDSIREQAMVQLFRAIIANNRAGGWRKLKKGGAG